MANDNSDFFAEKSDDTQKETIEDQADDAPSTVKVGDKEYDPDELQELVGLGELGRELEDKYNTDFDSLRGAYTKTTQELAELRKTQQEQEQQQIQQRARQGEQLSQEEQDRLAEAELNRLGYTKQEDIAKYVNETVEARELIMDTEDFIEEQKYEGKPEATVEEVFREMQRSNSNMEEAYRNLFPSQIKAWEDAKLQEVQPEGLTTDSTSTAGSKQPVSKTFRGMGDDDLAALIDQKLGG